MSHTQSEDPRGDDVLLDLRGAAHDTLRAAVEVGAEQLGNAEAGGGGSDYTDNTVATESTVSPADPAPVTEQIDIAEYPFLYYLLEVRRG